MLAFLQQLGDVVRHIGLLEVIDVAVVAFVLYQLLRLLRGTQGTQILVGLILLAVTGVIATQFNLILLSWLFRNATSFIIIAVIVMFQPELRRALTAYSRNSGLTFRVASNPEFLREGTAVYDYFHPPKTVIGEVQKGSGDVVAKLYGHLPGPMIRTDQGR